MNLRDALLEQEIQDLSDLKDITENACADGFEIVCYIQIQEMIYNKKNISDFLDEDLLKILAQVKASITFLGNMGFVDTDSLNIIYKKLRTIFSDEMKQRKNSYVKGR